MKEERKNRIYDRGTGEWFSVSEEEFAEYDRWRRTLRQKEQYCGRCCCPKEKWWVCDGMCDDCEFRCGEKPLSLDEPMIDDDGCESCLLDLIPGNDVGVEEVTADRDLVEKLLQLLREMDPDADRIIELWREDWKTSDRKIAEKLGRKQRNFAYQMKRYREAAKIFLEK